MHENASTKVAVTTSVTPVHGRPEFSKHRNSNHQRNLSLDFRYDVTSLITLNSTCFYPRICLVPSDYNNKTNTYP